jgi:phenylacetate-CoA ligase
VRDLNISPSEFKYKIGLFVAEPWTENMRKQLEEKWHIKGYDCYGLTEICGPGAGGECEYQNGSHLWEDHFLPEIIDPQTLKPVPIGKEGELVITTFAKEG